MKTVEERFWCKVNKHGRLVRHMTTYCWEWTAAKNQDGYGRFAFQGKVTNAHIVSFLLAGKELKSGECVLHTCDNPSCVRPHHLYAGTKKDNAQDRESRGRANHATGLRHGCSTHPGLRRGEGNSHARLTEAQVRSIIQRLKRGEKQTALAKEFALTRQAIFGIASGKTWRHVER